MESLLLGESQLLTRISDPITHRTLSFAGNFQLKGLNEFILRFSGDIVDCGACYVG